MAASDPAFPLSPPSPTPGPHAPLPFHLPSLMIPDGDGQSLPSSARDALKHHCGREGSIRFSFFIYFSFLDDNDNLWT